LFEKFFRAPGARRGGVGLGLAVCRGIVEAHGGTIAVERAPTAAARASWSGCRRRPRADAGMTITNP
jgi:signal transduction histidine kinase